ncbi:hypothetical protein [Paenibacillus qinlingensis]|nr:hypothetical protein [Paenibacillus qinlingensis]
MKSMHYSTVAQRTPPAGFDYPVTKSNLIQEVLFIQEPKVPT